MDALIRWSLRSRVVVVVLALFLCGWGLYTTVRLPIDVFPDLTAPTVTVITEAHGMAPTDLETQVTFPVETAMTGARGVRRVRSLTVTGVSVVWVEFQWDVEVKDARQVVSERLSLVTPRLPEGVDQPLLAPVTSIMGEILFLGLTSDTQSDTELRTIADASVRRRLLAIPGVAQVTVLGGSRKQYQVRLSPDALLAHSATVGKVAEALRSANENRTAGLTAARGSQFLVTGRGRIRTLDDMSAVAVRTEGTMPLTVGDLGRAVIGGSPRIGDGGVSGKPAVVIGVQKQPGVNTLTLSDRINRVLGDIERRLPDGVTLETNLFRQRDFIDAAVQNVFHALRDGSVLVVLIMILFLANARAIFITLTAIPLSLCAAVIVLDLWGATINTMTLGGMAIAIGALVDDAVIDVENVVRRLRQGSSGGGGEGRSAFQIVLAASIEIRSSIAIATFIVILVFVPVFFLGGVEGRLLQPLGVSYTVSLLASLLVAVTLTPVLCYLLLPSSPSILEARQARFARLLQREYGRLLPVILRRPSTVLVPTGVLFACAVTGAFLWGRSFLPDFNEGNLTVTAGTLPGTSLEESRRLATHVENTLLSHPEVVSTARRTGRSEGDEHVQGLEGSEFDVVLSMKDRSKEEFLEALRGDLATIPGVNISIGQPISHRIDHMLSGTEASIAVKLFGRDLYGLRALAGQVEAAMRSVEGAVDVAMDQQLDIPLLQIHYDRAALARHGLGVREVADVLESAYAGLRVSTIFEADQAYDLVIRIDGPADDWGTEALRELPVGLPGGGRVPLSALARIKEDLGPNRITRERGRRKLVVQANVAGRDIGSVVGDVMERVDPLVAAMDGYEVEYGGQFESAREAGRLLLLLGIGVILGIGALLHTVFGSFRDTLFVMANLPLALIGGVLGVYLDEGVLSIASMIGFITVFGIAARNGILLVSHFRHLQLEEGVTDFREAVHRGATERLIPVLMTALGTALALVPLALSGNEPGNEIQAPMAIVILCGLFTSTLLNMIVVPPLYLRFGRPVFPGGRERRGEA